MALKNQWLRISLRTFLLLLTCSAVGLACFANYATKRKAAFTAIREAGGNIRMAMGEPSRLERWFGAEVFGRVQKVDLRKGTADNALLSHIGILKEIQRLDLSDADIDDEGLRQIEHLPLRELWLQDTNITDQSAKTISKMAMLDFLQLNATQLSDSFLEHLNALPHLSNLGLRGTQVTSGGMKHLARHPQLKALDVYQTTVDDAGVEHLLDCQSLADLGLSTTKVTDHVFEHLSRLPNLTEADLTANRPVTTAAVLAFEKSHPKCDIEWYRK